MQDEHISKGNKPQQTLDERLTAYYGSALPEQPLPPSSWTKLSSQLVPQHRPRTFQMIRFRRLRRFLMRDSHIPPSHIQAVYSRIAYEAGFPFVLANLSCTLDRRRRAPKIRVSLLGKRPIRLRLPLNEPESLAPSALDVLLATGLARYVHMRKPAYLIPRLLLIVGIVTVWAAFIAYLVLWQRSLPTILLPIAIVIGIVLNGVIGYTLHLQSRRMAIRADNLLVLWLGRSQACQGLHALADLSPTQTHRAWGELSLAERISRICSTRVPAIDERLTLVR
jgi:hypothetical protein